MPSGEFRYVHADCRATIGVVGNAPQPLIFNKTLVNLTKDGYWVWDSLWTWPTYPEQWSFKA